MWQTATIQNIARDDFNMMVDKRFLISLYSKPEKTRSLLNEIKNLLRDSQAEFISFTLQRQTNLDDIFNLIERDGCLDVLHNANDSQSIFKINIDGRKNPLNENSLVSNLSTLTNSPSVSDWRNSDTLVSKKRTLSSFCNPNSGSKVDLEADFNSDYDVGLDIENDNEETKTDVDAIQSHNIKKNDSKHVLIEKIVSYGLENSDSRVFEALMEKTVELCHILTFENPDYCFIQSLENLFRFFESCSELLKMEKIFSECLSYYLLCHNFYHRLTGCDSEQKIQFLEPEFLQINYPKVSSCRDESLILEKICLNILEKNEGFSKETTVRLFCVTFDSLTTLTKNFAENDFVHIINFILTENFIPGLCIWLRNSHKEIIDASFVYVKKVNIFYLISTWLCTRNIDEKREFIIKSKSHRLLNLFLPDFYDLEIHQGFDPSLTKTFYNDYKTINDDNSSSFDPKTFPKIEVGLYPDPNHRLSESDDLEKDLRTYKHSDTTILLSKTIFEEITNTICKSTNPRLKKLNNKSPQTCRINGVNIRKDSNGNRLNPPDNALNMYFLDLMIESYDHSEIESSYTNTIFAKLFQMNSYNAELILKEFIIATKTNKLASIFFDKCKTIDSFYVEVCLICDNFLDNIKPINLGIISQSHYFPFLTQKLENFVTAIKKLCKFGNNFDAEKAGHSLFRHHLTLDELGLKKFYIFLETFPNTSESMYQYFHELAKKVSKREFPNIEIQSLCGWSENSGVIVENEKTDSPNDENSLYAKENSNIECNQNIKDSIVMSNKRNNEQGGMTNLQTFDSEASFVPSKMFLSYFFRIMNCFRNEMANVSGIHNLIHSGFCLFLETCLFSPKKCYDIFFVKSFNIIAKSWDSLYYKNKFLEAFINYKDDVFTNNSFHGIISSKSLKVEKIYRGCFFDRIFADIIKDRCLKPQEKPILIKNNQKLNFNEVKLQKDRSNQVSNNFDSNTDQESVEIRVLDQSNNSKENVYDMDIIQQSLQKYFYTSADLIKILYKELNYKETSGVVNIEKVRQLLVLLQKINQYSEGICFYNSRLTFPITRNSFCVYAIFWQYEDSGQQKLIQFHTSNSICSILIQKGLVFKQIKYDHQTESHHIKDIALLSKKIYLGVSFKSNVLQLSLNQQDHSFEMKNIDRITIGEDFKGILRRFLWYDRSDYNKKYLKEKKRAHYFVSYLSDLQKILNFKGRSGLYIDSKSVFFLTNKIDVESQNILVNKNVSWIDNKEVQKLILSEIEQNDHFRNETMSLIMDAIKNSI